jgi:hypothetical protein
MSKAADPDPLFELTLAVADWMSAKKLNKTCDEINAAITQTLAHLDRDEADDIVLRAAKLVRKQFEARQEAFITKQITERQYRRIHKPERLREQHGDVLVRTLRIAMRKR